LLAGQEHGRTIPLTDIEGESGTCLAALAHDQNRRGKPW
jgi:hypothetical protein